MNSQDRKPSLTAVSVAVLRAMHQLHDGSPKILSDPVIPQLLDQATLDKINSDLSWKQDALTTGLRSHVVLRSRYAEDRLRDAVGRGVRQYVSLGSGLDTFGYRQPPWASALRIFEVDHAPSQRAKVERLRACGISIPPNVEFVAADFESASLREIFSRSSLDVHAPAFFSCLGVLVYLAEDAVQAIFELIASFPKGSEFVLTFSQGESTNGAVKKLADASAKVGEPWRTYHSPEELTRQLLKSGFSEVSVLSPQEAKDLYYRDRQDNLPPPSRSSIACAIV
ncbi:MAG TPA: SAM-dependent methyltransferase [Candidatus Angelobacter sp.]|nr:SAM-dependent methyltransferase [Candidatus Angelobacter sp.]